MVLELNPQFFFPRLRHRNCKQNTYARIAITPFFCYQFPSAASAKRGRELSHFLSILSTSSEI